jgi:hypothetical protein
MMNERIQKLIEQATSTQGPTPYNPLTFEVFDKEKFAQLIVQECIEIVEYKGRKVGAEHPVGFNLMDAAWDIRESFGVEL